MLRYHRLLPSHHHLRSSQQHLGQQHNPVSVLSCQIPGQHLITVCHFWKNRQNYTFKNEIDVFSDSIARTVSNTYLEARSCPIFINKFLEFLSDKKENTTGNMKIVSLDLAFLLAVLYAIYQFNNFLSLAANG